MMTHIFVWCNFELKILDDMSNIFHEIEGYQYVEIMREKNEQRFTYNKTSIQQILTDFFTSFRPQRN